MFNGLPVWTATKDGEMVLVAANQDTVFTRLAKVMDQPELATDDRFATHSARGANAALLDDMIAEWTSTIDADDLLQLVVRSGESHHLSTNAMPLEKQQCNDIRKASLICHICQPVAVSRSPLCSVGRHSVIFLLECGLRAHLAFITT